MCCCRVWRLFAFWATPIMTVTHLVVALATTAYILIAIQLEERDLLDFHGKDYAAYQRRTPMLLPGLGRTGLQHAARQQAVD